MQVLPKWIEMMQEIDHLTANLRAKLSNAHKRRHERGERAWRDALSAFEVSEHLILFIRKN